MPDGETTPEPVPAREGREEDAGPNRETPCKYAQILRLLTQLRSSQDTRNTAKQGLKHPNQHPEHRKHHQWLL